MNYVTILKNDYNENKTKYLEYISKLIKDDNSKIANMSEITNHLNFIFKFDNSILVFLFNDDELISMVNAYEYNMEFHEWCVFSLFTKNKYRGQGIGIQTLQYILDKILEYNPSKIISGIEKENETSIKLHEKIGFKYSNCDWNELAEGFPENHLGFEYKIKDRK